MDIFDRIEHLLKARGMSQADLARVTQISTGLISQWKKRTQKPSAAKLQAVAEALGVSVDYLLGNTPTKTENPPAFTQKDERDIARRLEAMLGEMEGPHGALMFDGEPLDDETRELLRASLENQLRMTKMLAKQKYTPKKYRKTQEEE